MTDPTPPKHSEVQPTAIEQARQGALRRYPDWESDPLLNRSLYYESYIDALAALSAENERRREALDRLRTLALAAINDPHSEPKLYASVIVDICQAVLNK